MQRAPSISQTEKVEYFCFSILICKDVTFTYVMIVAAKLHRWGCIPREFLKVVCLSQNLTWIALQYWHPKTKHRDPRPLNLNQWAKAFKYPPDGSGRDRYIKYFSPLTTHFLRINEGGLKGNASKFGLKMIQRDFMSSLRKYGRSSFYPSLNERKKPDYFSQL
jgi:hypothetical protein